MKHYYIDPNSLNLIVRDTEKNDITIVERIEKVRVFTLSEVRIGDFEGDNPDDLPENFDQAGGYANHYHDRKYRVDRQRDKGDIHRTIRRATKKVKSELDPGPGKGKRTKITPEVLHQIQVLSAEGKSVSAIAEECNVSYGTAYKYGKRREVNTLST